MSLDSLINRNIATELDEAIMHKWDSILVAITSNDIYTRVIDSSEADKYIFDFNGLLESINIPEKFWYPHIRLNNFKSFTEYDGRTTIYLLEGTFLDKMYSVINNNSLLV